ncbi:SPW repeat domain-containing protein [Geminicoccus flavidas]|uniref:SPW repeat domain-containing protein n=1 Tax=Geminicoccus flavidas TaxID=2506407 RepID=UPI00190F1CAA|nr:hypothetical protein [Geminicoccus flavidas]
MTKMRFLSTRAHGALDYIVAIILIGLPYMAGTADRSFGQWIPILLGISIIVYSLLTRYELAIVRLIPMPVHLILDAGGGVLLIASPWLFGFAERSWVPFVLIGLFEIATALMTRTDTAPLHRDATAGRP